MQPHVNPSLPPPFHELGEYPFQELCCDLFAEEESVASCEIFGTRGQMQRGIDLFAPRRDGDGSEVAQCKCYRGLSVSRIPAASDKFFEHLEYWRACKVKRFVLIAACPLDRTEHHEAIQDQKARFAQHGIAYEAWSARTLRQKLAPHRAIAERYISSRDLVNSICGRSAGDVVELPSGGAHLARALDAAGSQIAQLSSALSREKSARLEEARTLIRRGQRSSAYALVRAIRDDPTWSTLEKPLQARVLRVLAGCVLDVDGDAARVQTLADEAQALDPTADDSVIRAAIRYHENGPRAALAGLPSADNIDTLNYRLGLLLELGETEQFLAILANGPDTIEVNAETLRIQALASVTTRDLAGARRLVDRALAQEPEWESVRVAAGVVEYYSALSAAALPEQLPPVPGPVPWEFIKRDDESREYLRSAENRFHLLSTSPERPPEWRRVFSLWRFACLANDPNRQPEASELCRSLLSDEPGDPRVLMWALARGYDVDIAASRTFVEASLSEAPDAPDAASLLVAMCLSQGKSAEALELLDRTKDVFVQAGLLERWLFWRVQVLSARGAVAEALQVADSCKDAAARRQLRQLALQGKFEQDGQWQELLQHLESSFEETGDPRLLYDACNLKARLEDWPYVADRANRLLELIGTPAAVHLAAGSLWNAKRFTACLKLLDNGSRVFPGGSLPRELRRLRIYCMQEVGLVSKAVVEAEHLSHEEQNTDNLLALIQSLVLTGDLKRVAVSARSLSAQDDVPARDLLRVGRLLVSEDVNLGRQLWRRAVQLDLSDPTTLTAAVDLAYRLGLEEEVRPLLERMHALAAEGSPAVRRVGFAELISMSRAWAEQLPAVETTYRSGQVPVHVLAQLLKVPLVNLIPGTGRRNRISPDPRHQLPMLIRHGNRGAGETSILGDNTRRLHIDITGMLAAHDLGILDAVERCFKALWISPSAMPALVVQLATLVPQQPVHLSGQKHVLELLERQGLCATEAPTAPPRGDPHLVRRMGIEWIGVLERAAAQNGYLVEHLPLTSNDDTRSLVTLSERDAARIVNCRTLVDALRRDGVLSSDAHSKAIDRLGNEGIQRSDTVPPERGSIVYLVASTAGVLADSNLLDLICDHFEVYVDRRYVEQIRSELAGVDAAGVLRGWLQTLVDRVRNGLMSGVYQTTQVDDEAPKLQAAERGGVSLDVRALGDLLAFAVQSGDAIWVDDRYVTSFSNRDGAPVVGILEVLQELRSRCAIDEPQYYEKLLQLRASNARYVALTPEELLYYLKDAPITEGRLVETNALSTLRRYVAACLLDRAPLQRGPAPQGRASPYGELNFVFQTLTAVTLTLCRCFGEAPSIESAQAWADWLLYNVYTGTFGVRELLVADISGDGLDFIGRDLAVAIWGMLTVLADSGAGATDETRSRYMHWIEERILRRRFKADPAVILPTYLALKAVVIDKLNAYPESTPEGAVYRIALQRMFLEAPPAVRDEVKRDPELFPRIGLAVTWTIQVGPVTFSAPEFFRAAADAINGREAVVCAQGATSSFTVRKASRQGDERLAIEVVEQQGSTQLRASDPIFRLLQDSPAEREAVLRENRNWFDCEASRCEAAINEIMSTADPALRIERLERRRASSAACYYERIAEELEHSRSFDINDLLPPSASDLLSHFRLDISEAGNDRSFKAMLSEASEQLIAEEGIKEALGRVASFPVPTPAPLLRELKNLTSSARNQIIEALERQCHSPIGLLHVIELAVPLLSDDEIPRQIAIRAMDALFDEPAATREFELFHAILERVHTELSSWVDVSTWPASVKLAVAWAHSHKLHAIFSSTLADADKLAEWIEQAGSQMGSESLGRQPETWNDALHPRLLRREDILTHGLASVLQGSSAETIESLRIPERIRSIIFGGPLGAQLPGGPLLRDPALTRNCAGSIFGGDRATVLRAVVGAEVSESVSSASLHGVVSRALDVLKYDVASQYAWVVVTSIVCDLPIHEDLREELRAILFAVDLEALWSRDAFSGYLAIRFAAGQVAHIDDCALRASVEEALVKIAHHLDGLGKRQNQLSAPVSIEDHAINLIDAALRIAHYPGEEQKTSTRSAQLLIKLLNASSAVSESVRSTAPRLVWELPARQLHGMWQVELELRARAGGQAV